MHRESLCTELTGCSDSLQKENQIPQDIDRSPLAFVKWLQDCQIDMMRGEIEGVGASIRGWRGGRVRIRGS